jgi:SNF family Na+-dependent transporter
MRGIKMEFEIMPGEKYLHDVKRPFIWLGNIKRRYAEWISLVMIFGPVFILMFLDKKYYPYLTGWMVCITYFMFLQYINFNYEDERGDA